MAVELSIGQLSETTRCKVPTIRYYEQIGMMPAVSRTSGNQRRYGPEHVKRLQFIQHCRDLGFRQNAIIELLALTAQPSQGCEVVTELAKSHLEEINRRIARFSGLKLELERMIDSCSSVNISECRIIEGLADTSNADAS